MLLRRKGGKVHDIFSEKVCILKGRWGIVFPGQKSQTFQMKMSWTFPKIDTQAWSWETFHTTVRCAVFPQGAFLLRGIASSPIGQSSLTDLPGPASLVAGLTLTVTWLLPGLAGRGTFTLTLTWLLPGLASQDAGLSFFTWLDWVRLNFCPALQVAGLYNFT